MNEAYSGGVFGNGLYFADCASKADEYVREVLPSEICELGGEQPLLAGHAAMFCSRVLLGRPYENVVKPSKNVKLNIGGKEVAVGDLRKAPIDSNGNPCNRYVAFITSSLMHRCAYQLHKDGRFAEEAGSTPKKHNEYIGNEIYQHNSVQ